MASNNQDGRRGMRRHIVATAAAAACAGMCGSAAAFDLDVGNDDVQVRFDNTVRYNIGQRVQGQDPLIINSPNNNDGDLNFSRKSLVNNRVDLLTEFDAVYQKRFGARVSAASWYDAAYSGSLDNTNVATSNHMVNGAPALGLSPYANRYYNGPSGEILDAFVFGNFDIAGMPAGVRVGRHTVNWGEALLGSGAIHGVTYGQAPLDQAKALAMPGVEAKELYMPLGQISGSLQATPELSFAAQYYLEWKPTRAPEAGTYLGFSDSLQFGGESIIQGATRITRRPDDLTPKQNGDWGLATRWSPSWLDGTLGAYWRNFSDKQPQAVVVASPTSRQYTLNFGDDISMLGFSLAKQVAGVSVGADVNWRRNMPLVASTIATTAAAANALQPGDMFGPRGKTFHGVLNAIGTAPVTPLWDSASWSAEMAYSRWLSVSQGLAYFKGNDTYTGIDRVSKSNWTAAVNFTPTWFQVFPGADLSMPLAYSRGMHGNSSVAAGGNQGAGSWSAGLGMDLYSKYRFDLKYVGYFGDLLQTSAGLTSNGTQALLRDRGAVYLTFKTTL